MAYTEPQASKPYKVCPEVVEAKDTPCRVLGPNAAIVQRMEVPNPDKKKIKELEEKIKALEEENTFLRSVNSVKNKPKVDLTKPTPSGASRGNEAPPIDIEKPSNTRAIRG